MGTALNSLFDFPHTGKIFIDLALVITAQLLLQLVCIVFDQVQNTLSVFQVAGTLFFPFGATASSSEGRRVR